VAFLDSTQLKIKIILKICMTQLKQLIELAELENYSFNKNIKYTLHKGITFDEIHLISNLDH
jgi:hypothetical protein